VNCLLHHAGKEEADELVVCSSQTRFNDLFFAKGKEEADELVVCSSQT
jgi:hypothetical protein